MARVKETARKTYPDPNIPNPPAENPEFSGDQESEDEQEEQGHRGETSLPKACRTPLPLAHQRLSIIPLPHQQQAEREPQPTKIKTPAGRRRKPSKPQPLRQPAPHAPQVRKKRKWRPGTVALREIRKYQKSVDFLIPKTRFRKVVREVMDEIHQSQLGRWYFMHSNDRMATRWTSAALEAIQTAAEDYLVDLLEDTQLAAIHAKHVTITDKDMQLVRRMRSSKDAARNP